MNSATGGSRYRRNRRIEIFIFPNVAETANRRTEFIPFKIMKHPETPGAAASKNPSLALQKRIQFTLPAIFITITVIACLFGATLFVARVAGMNETQALFQVFMPWMIRFPEVAVWAVGAIVLLRHRSMGPRVKRLVVLGLAGLLVVSFTSTLLNMGLVNAMVSRSIPGIQDYYWQITVTIGFIASLLKAVCWLTLLRAALGFAT